MTKYSTVQKKETPRKIRQVHPIWRGIGCAFMLLIPVVSVSAGIMTIDYGLEQNWPIPYQLLGYARLPDFIYKVPALTAVFGPIGTWEHFYAYAAATIVYMVVLGGILSFVNALIYEMVGPSRWGPQDVPPPKFKGKDYHR
ncbi:MAG: hypothetical protein AB1649_11590 [Chloroflexota bacterium]